MTQGAYVHLDHETLKVEFDGETRLQVPLHHLGGVACFGNVMSSPALIHRCAEDGRAFVLFDELGRFKARVEGPVSGNVLLRHAQYLATQEVARSLEIARNIVAGKIQNARQMLLRARREAVESSDSSDLQQAARRLGESLLSLKLGHDLNEIRGVEGEAAHVYFGVFGLMVREDRGAFSMNGRTRRPPKDRVNALLSFLYALLLSDCVSAAEGVGLDPQVGFLHALRPGRPALGLDLLEEWRPLLADRVALTLVNRRQVTSRDFDERPGGAVYLSEKGRREVVVAYQKRKKDEVHHRVLDKKIPLGLGPHLQARLLARHLRGDLDQYMPFIYR